MRRDPKHQGADAEFEEHIRTGRCVAGIDRPRAEGTEATVV
jgi:hypothetical protein